MTLYSLTFLSLLYCTLSIKANADADITGKGSVAGIVTKQGHLPLDVDGYPVAPPELELQQVHIYVRHGERTPVSVRMAGPPANIPENWLFCHTARELRTAVADTGVNDSEAFVSGAPTTSIAEELRARRIVERPNGTAAVGECLLGELTDVGRESTYKFGSALRKLYIDRLKFLPDVIHSNDEIYLRSTNIPRTIESLQQIVHGLYPRPKTAEGFIPYIRIRNPMHENLYGNTNACKRLETLQMGFAKAAAAVCNPTLEPLNKKISKYLGGNPVRLDGRPKASGILDTIRAAEAHGVQVPKEFQEPGVMDVIEKAVVTEWFAGYRTEEVRRLGMGPLLDDLVRKMQDKAEKRDVDDTKILIHSTHDTCLAGLSSALEMFDEKWPAFAAAITFELFKKRESQLNSPWQNEMTILADTESNTAHYVRVRYQNENKVLPFCAQEGKHLPGTPEFCTLAAFRERVKELTPADWAGECAATSGSGDKLRDHEEAVEVRP